jgi:hypothetical protein
LSGQRIGYFSAIRKKALKGSLRVIML